MVRTIPLPKCPICDTPGKQVYTELKDELFKTDGSWSMDTCTNVSCGTYWLNPTPLPSDLGQLYTTYSTHVLPPTNIARAKNNILDRIRETVLKTELSYPPHRPLSPLNSLLYSLLSFVHPAWRDTQLAIVFYLPAMTGGRLLDIGCGNGSSMLVLKEHGWHVEGIDFDEKSIAQARTNGLKADVGELKDFHYPDNSFDAIMMSHVIEHVPEPIDFLRECLRILKPGGTLVAITPNATSLGHRRFGSCWRGLEVPRHLHVFTPTSLALAAEKAGYSNVESFTSVQGILQIYDESQYCRTHGTFDPQLSSTKNRVLFHLRWFVAGWRHILFPQFSEVAVLRSRK